MRTQVKIQFDGADQCPEYRHHLRLLELEFIKILQSRKILIKGNKEKFLKNCNHSKVTDSIFFYLFTQRRDRSRLKLWHLPICINSLLIESKGQDTFIESSQNFDLIQIYVENPCLVSQRSCLTEERINLAFKIIYFTNIDVTTTSIRLIPSKSSKINRILIISNLLKEFSKKIIVENQKCSDLILRDINT